MIDLERTDYEFRRKIKETTVKKKVQAVVGIRGFDNDWIMYYKRAIDGGDERLMK